ncbi:MAG: helix-turn-helix domain-containing protein [Austwickia sp.]|jgi:DNA-binding transcriptional ArsR family regulator|nr:helix-turn-helix domain-containing protein [Austwickia sp.]
MPASDTPTAASVRTAQSRALGTLAHPLRSRLLWALREEGPATATALASTVGTNSGATSYHLRKLAEAGLIEDAPGGRGRERRWRVVSGPPPWRAPDLADDDASTALRWLERDYLRHFAERAEQWIDEQDRWPAQWSGEMGLSDALALVDVDHLRQLRAELAEVLARYRRLGQGNPGARRVAVYTCLYPVDLDRPPLADPAPAARAQPARPLPRRGKGSVENTTSTGTSK